MTYKIPEPKMFTEYSKLSESFETEKAFLDAYTVEKKSYSRITASSEATYYWLEDEEYPLAYRFNKVPDQYYVRLKSE